MQAELKQLLYTIQARISLIHVPTREEDRLIEWLGANHSFDRREREIRVWSSTSGLVSYVNGEEGAVNVETQSPAKALAKVLEIVRQDTSGSHACLYVFRDLQAFYREPQTLRYLRDLGHELKGTRHVVILVSPTLHIPEGFDSDITVCDFPLPDRAILEEMVYQPAIEDLARSTRRLPVDTSAELKEQVLQALGGMTFAEATSALAKALVEVGGFTSDILDLLVREKSRYVRRVPGLEYVAPGDVTLENVGGFDVAKDWFARRKNGATTAAAAFGCEEPKGVLMLGLPGTGKSLIARAVAHEWKVPLLRLDMGAIKEGVVGKSEGNFKAALDVASGMGRCVLWLDEIEKAFAGATASFVGDSGVAKGMYGMLLTWMQEQSGVFVYMTANDISALPPEFMRKGRIDNIFFIDFPSAAERAQIFAIHLARRGRVPDHFDLALLAESSLGFVGAEIEEVVKSALYLAFERHQRDPKENLSMADLMAVIRDTVPLCHTMGRQLQPMLRFVEERRAVRASSARDEDIRTLTKQILRSGSAGETTISDSLDERELALAHA